MESLNIKESRTIPEFGTSYIKKKNDVEEKEQKLSFTNKYTPTVPGTSISKVATNASRQNTSTFSTNNLDNGFRNRNSVLVNDSSESKSVPLNNKSPITLTPHNSVITKSLSTSQTNLQNTNNLPEKKVNSDRSSISNSSFNRYSQNLKDDYGVQDTRTTPEFGTSYIKKRNDLEEKEQKNFVANKYTPTVPGISIDKANVNISNETLEAKPGYLNNFNKSSLQTNRFSHSSNENLNVSSQTSPSLVLNKSLSTSQNNIQVTSNLQGKSLSTSQNNLQITSNLQGKSLSTSQNNLQITSNLQGKSLSTSQNNLQAASINRYSQNIKEDYGIERENSGTFLSNNSGSNQARIGNRSPVPTKPGNFFSGSSSRLSDQSPIPSKPFGGEKEQAPNFNDSIVSQTASERMAFFRQAAEEERLKEEKQREKEKRDNQQREKDQREREQREREQKARSAAPPSPTTAEKKEDNDDDDIKDSEKMKFAAPCMKKREKKKVVRRTMSIGSIVLDWVQEMVKDYPVEVKNFSSSWNDGMVFCALIHRFNPTEFDFSLLKPENKRENFNTAFETGKKVKNIPILLDTEDMVRMDKPEPRSVQCYVQWIWSVYGPTSGYGPTPGEVQT